jgi:competence protein ComEC
MKRPALYILIPFCLGIAFSRISGVSIFYSILAASGFIIVSILYSRHRAVSQIALFLAIFFTGMSVYLNSNILPRDHIANFIPPDEHNDIFVRGTIVDDPLATPTLYKTVRTSFTLKASLLKDGASWRKTNGLLKVDLFSKKAQPVSFGNEVILEGTLSKPHGLNNPGLFNYAEYLQLKNIYCCLRVKEGNGIQVLKSDSFGSVKFLAYRIRHRMRALIDEYLIMPYSGFLKAILIGDRSGLKDRIKEDFVKTGTVHMLVINGLHVGLIAAFFLAMFRIFRVPKKMNLAITTVLLVFYSFIAGSNPPVIRAVVMFAIYSIGYIIDRDADTLNSLSIAALAILLVNPKEMFDPGFQLTFISVASIIVFTPKLESRFPHFASEGRLRKKWAKAYRYLTEGISVSVAVWLGSLPFFAAYFNIVSPACIILNLIAIPMLFLLIIVSFLFFVLCFVSVSAAMGLAQGLQLAEKTLFAINGSLANSPFAYFRVAKPSFEFTLLYYALVSLLIIPPGLQFKNLKITRMRIAIGIMVLFNILVWTGAPAGGADGMRMTFLDVGQGDSAFLEFPSGGTMLVDGGPGGEEDGSDMGESVVAPFLWNRGVKTIDILVVTHSHEDHLGGILYVLKNFNIGCVIDSGAISDSGKIYEEYLRLIKKNRTQRISVREGNLIRAFKGAEIFILNPEKDKMLADSNDNSLVLKVSYKSRDILLCGDIKDKAISRLISYGDFLKADIMKVPHHGGALGNTGIVKEFFDRVSPGIAIISVGAANKYGMPSGGTMAMITDLSSKLYLTKDSGAIKIYVNPRSNELEITPTK